MKTMIQAAAVTLFAASAAHAQQAVQWKVSDGGNGHWYWLSGYGAAATWESASALAASRGGHLVSITSVAEQHFVHQRTAAGSCEPTGVIWLGGDQPAGSSTTASWRWATGEAWAFTNWHPGEPNDYEGWVEDCLLMYQQSGTWIDGRKDGSASPFCVYATMVEWSADCNGDGIVDYGQCRDGTLPDYNGNNIPDCCETGTQCVTSGYPLQWRTAEGGNSHWYRALPDGSVQDWDRAKLHAESVGGYLASVTSAAESDFVWSRLASKPNCWTTQLNFSGPALGGYLEGGQWRWLSGEPWDFNSWGPCFSQTGEQRLHYGCNSLSNEWNDLFSWETNIGGAIIEWSADCNNDGIVDYGQILQSQLPDANSNGVPDRCECASNPALPACCLGNLNGDSVVDGADLGILLFAWGPAAGAPAADLNADGQVNGADLGVLLSTWGACP